MLSGAKASLGKLPGEPNKKPKPTAVLVPSPSVVSSSTPSTSSDATSAPTVALTKLTVKDVRTLMGKAVYPVYIDLSPSAFNLEDDSFLTNCTNVIKYLDLSGNSLMELESLGHLSKLKVLIANRNVLANVSLRGLAGLELLSLKQNRIETLTDMSDLKKLINLDLSHNRVASGFEELAALKSLRVLDLSFNKLELSLAEFHHLVIGHLKKLPRLEYLAFEGNPVETAFVDFRAYVAHELPKLKFLDWMPVTREERARGQRLDEQKQWDGKNAPFAKPLPQATRQGSKLKLPIGTPPPSAPASASTSQPAAPSEQQQEPPPAVNPQRLSTALDSLLTEIDGLGAGTPPVAVPPHDDDSPPPLRAVLRVTPAPSIPAPVPPAPPAVQQSLPVLEVEQTQPVSIKPVEPTAAATTAAAAAAQEKQMDEYLSMLSGIGTDKPPPVAAPPPHMSSAGRVLPSSRAPLPRGRAPLPPGPAPGPPAVAPLAVKPDSALAAVLVPVEPKPEPVTITVHELVAEPAATAAAPVPAAAAPAPPLLGSSTLVDMLSEMLAEEQGLVPLAKPPEQVTAQSPATATTPVAVEQPAAPVQVPAQEPIEDEYGTAVPAQPPPVVSQPPPPAVVKAKPPSVAAAMHMSVALSTGLPTTVADSLDDLVSSIAGLESTISVTPITSIAEPQVQPPVVEPTKVEPIPFEPVAPTAPTVDAAAVTAAAAPSSVAAIDAAAAATAAAPSPVTAIDAASIDEALGDLSTPTQERRSDSDRPPESQPPVTPRDPWDIQWGELSVKERLGEGSLGETNRGGTFRGAAVNIKRLRPQRFHPAFIAEFVADIAKSYGLAPHPNVARVIGGTTAGVVSYVCEHISGVNLAEYAAGLQRREALEARLAIAKGIASGIKFLHDSGIVHGSFKPSDVIVTDGSLVPRVRDYGFLRLKQTNLREGALFSPQYMPSEQFESNFEQFSPKTDVYSFGITLWHLFEGGLGVGKLEEPAPQDGAPLKLEFESTPNEIADIIMRCCLYDPTARPDFNEVLALLSLPMADVLRFYEAEVDPAVREQKRKLHLIAEKIAELIDSQVDFQVTKALAGIASLAKVEANAPAIWEERLHVRMLAALRSQHESVVEKTLRTFVELCNLPKFLEEVAKEVAPADVMALYAGRNDMVAMLALRLTAMLTKNGVAREKFFEVGIIGPLLRNLDSGNDLVVANAALACSRILKLAAAREPFFAGGGCTVMFRLLHGNNPAVQVHLLNSLASMLSYVPAQESIIREGIANRLFLMLGSRSELMQLQALKSTIRFSQSVHLLENISADEWVVAVQRHLLSKNAQVLAAACQALANLAYNDEQCDRLESLGALPAIIGFISSKAPDAKLQAQALNLLAKLLRCGSCRDTFRDSGGLNPLAKVYLANNHNAKVQHACLRVFLELSSDESAVDAIADSGVITAVVRQMSAAAARKDEPRLLTTLRLVRMLAQGPDNATDPIRSAGGVEKLLDLIANTPQGMDARQIRLEAGMSISSLIKNEDSLPIVSVTPGGFAALFSLLDFDSFEVQESILRQLSILVRQSKIATMLVDSGLLPPVAKHLGSPNVALQSLSLKIIVLLAQNADTKAAMTSSGIPQALNVIKIKSQNPVLRAAAEKTLSMF